MIILILEVNSFQRQKSKGNKSTGNVSNSFRILLNNYTFNFSLKTNCSPMHVTSVRVVLIDNTNYQKVHQIERAFPDIAALP
jgi:hypothetical protein